MLITTFPISQILPINSNMYIVRAKKKKKKKLNTRGHGKNLKEKTMDWLKGRNNAEFFRFTFPT